MEQCDVVYGRESEWINGGEDEERYRAIFFLWKGESFPFAEKIAHLEKLGMEQVKRALIQTIATNAGVSVLRVGKLFVSRQRAGRAGGDCIYRMCLKVAMQLVSFRLLQMREVEDGVDVLFVIAENATGVVPAKTVTQRVSIPRSRLQIP